ncbi:MAG: hypothetical protein JO001_19975 [Alphaproteobacteria bacterium]|nr:hypothetical protein [Alphaproteobacteria bacterium]
MSEDTEDTASRLDEVTAALKAAQAEKVDAYIQMDWTRVWELTNVDIPKLEEELAALTHSTIEGHAHAVPPIDFDQLSIEMMQNKTHAMGLHLRRHSVPHNRQVKVSVVFCDEQKTITDSMAEHVVFYQSQGEKQIKVKDLQKGPWVSDHMNEEDANKTAENALGGINDLRLIIQHRLRNL